MNILIYRILLEEPLLVTALEGDPNSSETLQYIPGSVLRGALLAAYMRKHGISEIDAADREIRDLFFSDTTCFLNGYPVVEGCRALPVPLSWRSKKGDDDHNDVVFDASVSPLPERKDVQWKVFKPKGFVRIMERSGKFIPSEIKLNVAVHTARNRRFGRPRPQDTTANNENGAVFRYVSLAARQEFEAVIVSRAAQAGEIFAPLLKGPFWLGGSRSAGYGKVRMELIETTGLPWRECLQQTPEDYDESNEETNQQEGGSDLEQCTAAITFLSDGLFRNARGQWAVEPEAICESLSCALNCKVQPHQQQAYLRSTLIGGFNRKWGLPLVQAQAVQMGSVLVVDLPARSKGDLKKLEETGIGERRVDGFGRIAVDWLHQPRWEKETAKRAESVQAVEIPAGSQAEAVAKTVVQRMLQARLETALIQAANSMTDKLKDVSASQLNRIIAVFQHARTQLPEEGRKELNNLLDALGEDTFTGARVGGKPLLVWLKERVNDQKMIWETLNIQNPPQIGSISATWDDDLAYKYNLRLVIAVLARAVKLLAVQKEGE